MTQRQVFSCRISRFVPHSVLLFAKLAGGTIVPTNPDNASDKVDLGDGSVYHLVFSNFELAFKLGNSSTFFAVGTCSNSPLHVFAQLYHQFFVSLLQLYSFFFRFCGQHGLALIEH